MKKCVSKKRRNFAFRSVLILELRKLLPAKLLWILHWAGNLWEHRYPWQCERSELRRAGHTLHKTQHNSGNPSVRELLELLETSTTLHSQHPFTTQPPSLDQLRGELCAQVGFCIRSALHRSPFAWRRSRTHLPWGSRADPCLWPSGCCWRRPGGRTAAALRWRYRTGPRAAATN